MRPNFMVLSSLKGMGWRPQRGGSPLGFPKTRRAPQPSEPSSGSYGCTVSWRLSLARIVPPQRARPREDAIIGRDQRGSWPKRRGGEEAISRIRREVEEDGRSNAHLARQWQLLRLHP